MDSNSHSNRTNTSWELVKLLFKTPDSGSVNIGLRLGFLNCETKGTVWFDNVKVEAVLPIIFTNQSILLLALKLTIPSLRQGKVFLLVVGVG